MGNCTSKKSSRVPKFSLHLKPSNKAMHSRDQIGTKGEPRGLSTKVAPCTKGEATSFGFKRRPASALPLPMPVQLTSRGPGMRQDVGSGSSVESLCHAAPLPATPPRPNSTSSPANRGSPAGAMNRFGFRSATPPRISTDSKLNRSPNNRSKSEGPKEAREAFFRPLLQQAGSANSVFNGSRSNIGSASHQFTLKTTQLPKPQFPVRLSEKAAKTATNYGRRDGHNDCGTSKEASSTDDSGIYSVPSASNFGETDTLHELELSESSPEPKTRSRSVGPRKLELRVVSSNKFELVDKGVGSDRSTVGTSTPSRTSICTGLVQKRTEQYLQRIAGVKDSNRQNANGAKARTSVTSPQDSTESEEEKFRKDSNKSEKNPRVGYLMNDGVDESDEMYPGEAMADEISLNLSSDEEMSSVERVERVVKPASESAIRIDAIKLSNQLKNTNPAFANFKKEDSSYALFNAEDRTVLEEDTILDLSSGSEKDSSVEKVAVELNGSTDTPSNASISEGRDFLIDDEIADQPQLCFSTHEDLNVATSGNNNGSEGTVLAASQGFPKDDPTDKKSRDVRRNSVGTLSPCESLLSDDLMMDFDTEDNTDGCHHNARKDAEIADDTRKAWVTLPRAASGANGKGINGRVSSGSSSPLSHRSPMSRASTEEDVSVRVDKDSYHHMFQDIVSIKSMLLKLNRLLSENEGNITPYPEEDATMDLKKQVAFLQQQLQQRELTLHNLQAEVNRKVNNITQHETRTLCNAATQTDRVRPVSTGPSLLQNLPSDGNNIVTNGRSRKISESLEEGTRLRSLPADTILEKVKALSFKPVDVVEHKPTKCNNHVYKITKIDLVLKSDNYGQKELRKT